MENQVVLCCARQPFTRALLRKKLEHTREAVESTAPITSREVFVWYSHADISALQSNEPPDRKYKCNVQAPNAKPTERLTQKTLCT
jgi:hypothetical protein